MASDDPEGWIYFEDAAHYAGADYDIHLLTALAGVHDVEVAAFQRALQRGFAGVSTRRLRTHHFRSLEERGSSGRRRKSPSH